MDFYKIATKEGKGKLEIYPDFVVARSKDLMVRAKSFYACWDEERGRWSTDEYDVQRLVDEELRQYAEEMKSSSGVSCNVKYLQSFGNQGWKEFRKYMQNISNSYNQLDEKLTFANDKPKKSDYVSRSLLYTLAPGDYPAWDELIGILYSPEERAKIEWAIGAVVSGDSRKIQKFLVLYGPAGSGKSTILNIIAKLFDGYVASFEAKALGSNNGTFSTESFRDNPLVAIQHDGDLSKIEDNTRLNSIIAHEPMTINEKFRPSYTAKINAFLFMGTNQPVKISDAKSGIIRRLIDVHPTGVRFPANHYQSLMTQIDFELGAIAQHCLDVYLKMGKNHYNSYRPLDMMFSTNIFFNFIESYYDVFKSQNGISLKQAYSMYKEYCNETGIERQLPQYKIRDELQNYFDEFKDRIVIDGVTVRSYYLGFNANKFKTPSKDDQYFLLVMDETRSIFDKEYGDYPAQYANDDGTPLKRWSSVKTTLSEIDTTKTHYVRIPENHIVIDFDLKDESGEKSLEMNLAAASVWPATYAEISKGESGVHLHYIYDGDVSELASEYSTGIEVKVYTGKSALRRKLTKCNNVPVASINSGLPFKEKKMLHSSTIQSEKGLRDLIARNLRKEIHPGTKPSIDFIQKILDDAYNDGLAYDVTDLRSKIVAFANNSSNQPLQALKIVQKMQFQGKEDADPFLEKAKDSRIVLFDIEVYPNLFVVCWKYRGDDNVVRMINPNAQEVEGLFSLKLVGFNNRRYDNHILYARYMGYNNEQLYILSQKIIANERNGMFGEAYNISYTDIYDFSSKKQGLKKFEIDLGLHHMELDLPWDEPVAEEDVERVVEYCVNDVIATEAVLDDREQDFIARQILADLSGLTVNDTTQRHTAKIIFGNDKYPQKSFKYTDLSKEFPGYNFALGKSFYKGEETGEGGYVSAEPGMYENVALLDIASMHPTTIEQLNLFGEYTPNFSALKDARIAIKHEDYDSARKMLGGKLKPYLKDEKDAKALSYALKIVINIVYGLTSAKFDNPFRDIRNVDNIVAKRGALFMIDLKEYVQSLGFTVAHIKTDSIKIPNATQDIIEKVTQFGSKYGYDFEHEATYTKFCLVNDAVYIARVDEPENPNTKSWVAVGAQFQHPYVFKTLFDIQDVKFDDMCETKQVTQGAMYLIFDETESKHFVGRTGRFIPVTPESGGALLMRIKDDKSYAVSGTKGFFWIEADMAKQLGDDLEIDMAYFENLTNEAIKTINKFGDYESFVDSNCE
jgi:energy-coupling factor transporter ATP-binding protein EcfA2